MLKLKYINVDVHLICTGCRKCICVCILWEAVRVPTVPGDSMKCKLQAGVMIDWWLLCQLRWTRDKAVKEGERRRRRRRKQRGWLVALSPVPAAQRDAGFVSWFSCTLVSDKKASRKYGNVQSPNLVSILDADFNKPEQAYMELYFPAVQNMITPTLICITVNCVVWFKHSNLETDSAALWWMKEGVGTFIVHPLRLATFYLGSLLENSKEPVLQCTVHPAARNLAETWSKQAARNKARQTCKCLIKNETRFICSLAL